MTILYKDSVERIQYGRMLVGSGAAVKVATVVDRENLEGGSRRYVVHSKVSYPRYRLARSLAKAMLAAEMPGRSGEYRVSWFR